MCPVMEILVDEFLEMLRGVKMYTWTWSSGQNLNDSTLINLTAGIYGATITDQNNCTAVQLMLINYKRN